jgi:hypothetical protein
VGKNFSDEHPSPDATLVPEPSDLANASEKGVSEAAGCPSELRESFLGLVLRKRV